MYELAVDVRQFEAAARSWAARVDQVPYALSRTINDAAFNTKQVLTRETWPGHVTQRNTNFPAVVLHINKSTKHDLRVSIDDTRDTGGLLQRHARGGVKLPHGDHLAIPNKAWVRYGAGGRVIPSQQPRAIIANTDPRALRVTARGIFVAEGGRLHLRYTFKSSARQPADVPLYEDFAETMMAEINSGFGVWLDRAMRTAW